MKEMERFVAVVKALRDPEHGCPWDKLQTFQSLKRFLIEETGELHDAIDANDITEIKEELGDILMQVVLNAQVATDNGLFTIEDVAACEADKMIRRHPHVFSDTIFKDDAERRADWEKKKSQEASTSSRKSAIDGVPRAMPALARAQKLSEKAARARFDWADASQVIGKVKEELDEVSGAIQSGNKKDIAEELGDLLFATVVLCRWQDVQAEETLQHAIEKFAARFRKMEQETDLKNASLDEMLSAWKHAKEQ